MGANSPELRNLMHKITNENAHYVLDCQYLFHEKIHPHYVKENLISRMLFAVEITLEVFSTVITCYIFFQS